MKRTIKNDKNLMYLYKINTTYTSIVRKIETLRCITRDNAIAILARHKNKLTRDELFVLGEICEALTGKYFPDELPLFKIRNAYIKVMKIIDKFEEEKPNGKSREN